MLLRILSSFSGRYISIGYFLYCVTRFSLECSLKCKIHVFCRGSALQKRLRDREKEMEADERDRKREKEELEEIRQRLLAEGHPDPDAELQRVSSYWSDREKSAWYFNGIEQNCVRDLIVNICSVYFFLKRSPDKQ